MTEATFDALTPSCIVTFYHDIEQDIDSEADRQACREAVSAFLALENRYGMPVTYNVVGRLLAEEPDLAKQIADAGQEIAFHSYHHYQDWNPGHYADEVAACRRFSDAIKGYRSPRSQWNEATVGALSAHGFLWSAEGDKSLEPYFVRDGVVRLPIATDDWPLHTGQLDVALWAERFETLLRERPYVAIGTHDMVASFKPNEMLTAWQALFDIARRLGAIPLNFSEACDLFRRAALSKYYTDTATRWNTDTRNLYRTKRFQELVRAETEKCGRPVVVDLGSGGGVLTAGLADIAERIYCVDNATGMVHAAAAARNVEARVGDVTDSGLPEGCADLVICARVIEYLYWPERLAEEIKRIAKPGATYIVTCPALRGDASRSGYDAPDRIRHYFTAQEIRDWAEAIGPGKLMGVQYEAQEPKNADEEARYRRLDEAQPDDVTPTNYVLIGTVEEGPSARGRRPVVPVSRAGFVRCCEREPRERTRFKALRFW
jgi:SAM-dependent methyltransferase